MQTPKTRSGSSQTPQKVSPRAVRQLKTTGLDTDSVTSFSQANKTSKEKSPKVTDRRSPRSPVPERKRPSRISELESHISQLQEDLKNVRDQLSLSESCKKQAEEDAEESKQKLLVLSTKFENSQQQLLKLSAIGEAQVLEQQKVTEEHTKVWQSELEASKKEHSVDSAALASVLNEIQQLKVQLELVANCEIAQTHHTESADVELLNLKQNLSETLFLVENMKNQLKDCKESEAQVQALANETLMQLEAAKTTVEILRAGAAKALDYNSITMELNQSRSRLNLLEELVKKHETDLICNKCPRFGNCAGDQKFQKEPERLDEGKNVKQIGAEICSLKSEVGRLRSAIEIAETKYQEEQIRNMVQMRNAFELMEQIKSEAKLRECDLEAELKRKKVDIQELKANLMNKETELQGIVEDNENLNLKLERIISYPRVNEIKRLEECVTGLKADLMDKETTLQSITEENEVLKLKINKRVEIAAEVEAAKVAELEAHTKLGIVMEEADKSNKKAARVAEQLEAAQAANSEMEAELRRLKVQSDQWRKAAEVAAAMLSAGNDNGKITERTVSLDNNYNHLIGRFSPYADDDFQRKKNGNMLKKIGVLWKKPRK